MSSTLGLAERLIAPVAIESELLTPFWTSQGRKSCVGGAMVDALGPAVGSTRTGSDRDGAQSAPNRLDAKRARMFDALQQVWRARPGLPLVMVPGRTSRRR